MREEQTTVWNSRRCPQSFCEGNLCICSIWRMSFPTQGLRFSALQSKIASEKAASMSSAHRLQLRPPKLEHNMSFIYHLSLSMSHGASRYFLKLRSPNPKARSGRWRSGRRWRSRQSGHSAVKLGRAKHGHLITTSPDRIPNSASHRSSPELA